MVSMSSGTSFEGEQLKAFDLDKSTWLSEEAIEWAELEPELEQPDCPEKWVRETARLTCFIRRQDLIWLLLLDFSSNEILASSLICAFSWL